MDKVGSDGFDIGSKLIYDTIYRNDTSELIAVKIVDHSQIHTH